MNANAVLYVEQLCGEVQSMAEHVARQMADYEQDAVRDVEWHLRRHVSSKDTAALRRRSMDLTRALAEMRKP